MAAGPHSIDPTTYLDDLLSQASPDLMREMGPDPRLAWIRRWSFGDRLISAAGTTKIFGQE